MNDAIADLGSGGIALHERLRSDILTGALPPASRITIRQLCDRFDVGLSPMREALNRIVSEGLIEVSESRRLQVAPVTLADLQELTETRCWLNEIGLRASIERGDQAWEERVLLLGHRLTKMRQERPQSPDRGPELNAVHREFHTALVAACGSRWLVEYCRQLFDYAERYRYIARLSGAQRPRQIDEHQQIADATVRRDAPRAVALLNAHFRTTADLVRDKLGLRADP